MSQPTVCLPDNMFTLIKVELNSAEQIVEEKYFVLVNGNNVKKFRTLMIAAEQTKRMYLQEEGVFFICEDKVIQTDKIEGELQLDALSGQLTFFYQPVPADADADADADANADADADAAETLYNAYVLEHIPEFVHAFFLEKKTEVAYNECDECSWFIRDEISPALINWEDIREKSPLTERELFTKSLQLTEALNSRFAAWVIALGELTPDVLWLTYILANHELFSSRNPAKNLRDNLPLIDLFVAAGLHEKLLLVATTGERQHYLSIHRRDEFNVLHPNAFVVKTLMPKYVTASSQITLTTRYHDEAEIVTPYSYYNNFQNYTTDISPFLAEKYYYEKNAEIKLYMEQHL